MKCRILARFLTKAQEFGQGSARRDLAWARSSRARSCVGASVLLRNMCAREYVLDRASVQDCGGGPSHLPAQNGWGPWPGWGPYPNGPGRPHPVLAGRVRAPNRSLHRRVNEVRGR